MYSVEMTEGSAVATSIPVSFSKALVFASLSCSSRNESSWGELSQSLARPRAASSAATWSVPADDQQKVTCSEDGKLSPEKRDASSVVRASCVEILETEPSRGVSSSKLILLVSSDFRTAL